MLKPRRLRDKYKQEDNKLSVYEISTRNAAKADRPKKYVTMYTYGAYWISDNQGKNQNVSRCIFIDFLLKYTLDEIYAPKG